MHILIIMPTIIPNSNVNNKHAKNVAKNGKISIRFDSQISIISFLSTILYIAHNITAANVHFGIYWNDVVNNPSDNNTKPPVNKPPNVVRTPLALLTVVRVNEPVVGIEWKNELSKLHIPNANISCVASIVLPLAKYN